MKTLRGYTPPEAIKLMIEPLGGNAYKPHPTKKYLTTIRSAYTRERLTKVFGIMGMGWGLNWEPENTVRFESKTNSNKTRYHFALLKADFWYVLICDDCDYEDRIICHIPVTGEHDNDNLGAAMSGARTSAIGQGAKELLFQLHIYKDMPPPRKNSPPPPPPKRKPLAEPLAEPPADVGMPEDEFAATAKPSPPTTATNKDAALRAKLEGNNNITFGTIASLAALTNNYTSEQHALNTMKQRNEAITSDKKTSTTNALAFWDWLMERKETESIQESIFPEGEVVGSGVGMSGAY